MKNLPKVMAISLFPLLMSHVCQAQKIIVQTWFTPNPVPIVHNDTVYLFTDHAEDDAQSFNKLHDTGVTIVADRPEQWKEQTTQKNAVKGVRDLYLLSKSGDEELFNIDYWTLNY